MKKFLIISISICLVLVCGYSSANNQKYDLLIRTPGSIEIINVAIFHDKHMCERIASTVNVALEISKRADMDFFCIPHKG